MNRRHALGILAVATALAAASAWHPSPGRAQAQGGDPTRFQFKVIESFDAAYLGDTPGHLGRVGGVTRIPDVALGDPVFHGDRKLGTISRVRWNRSADSLEIEFDPEPFERISVGEMVWISLTGPPKPAGR